MAASQKNRIYVCRGKSCTRRGAGELAAGLEGAFEHLGVEVAVLRHDCFDLCKKACNVMVETQGRENRIYTHLHPRYAGRLARGVVEDVQVDDLASVGD